MTWAVFLEGTWIKYHHFNPFPSGLKRQFLSLLDL